MEMKILWNKEKGQCQEELREDPCYRVQPRNEDSRSKNNGRPPDRSMSPRPRIHFCKDAILNKAFQIRESVFPKNS